MQFNNLGKQAEMDELSNLNFGRRSKASKSYSLQHDLHKSKSEKVRNTEFKNIIPFIFLTSF